MKPLVLLLAAAALAGCRSAETGAGSAARAESEPCRALASSLIAEYGPPDATYPWRLVWYEKGPWRRISLYTGAAEPVLVQAVSLSVPPAKRDLLERFDPDLRVAEFGRGFTVSSASQERNRLTANLAYELLIGGLDLRGAREARDRALALAAAGKEQRLMKELLFSRSRRKGLPVRPSFGPDPLLRDPRWGGRP